MLCVSLQHIYQYLHIGCINTEKVQYRNVKDRFEVIRIETGTPIKTYLSQFVKNKTNLRDPPQICFFLNVV